MRKKIGEEIVKKDTYIDVCDYCGKEFSKDEYGKYKKVTFYFTWVDYEELEGDVKEFCSFKCLIDFIKEENNKKITNSELLQMPLNENVEIEFNKSFLGEFLDLVKSGQ